MGRSCLHTFCELLIGSEKILDGIMVTLANDISNFDIIQSMLQFKALGFGFLVFLDKKRGNTEPHLPILPSLLPNYHHHYYYDISITLKCLVWFLSTFETRLYSVNPYPHRFYALTFSNWKWCIKNKLSIIT